MQFFSKRAGLGFLQWVRPEFTTMDYQNIDGMLGAIVNEGRATLNELRTIYSLEDACDIYESFMIPRYNEWLATEHAKNKK